MRGWGGVIGFGLGALVCVASALLSGFAGVLIGSDEALAAKPFYAAFLVFGLVGAGFLAATGAALVRAISSGRAASEEAAS